MRTIRTQIDIAAPPDKVWKTLMDFEGWREWNPTVTHVSGAAALGSRLSITMSGEACEEPGKEAKDGAKYTPVITSFEAPKLFRWRAKMLAGFIFTNDKVFELEEISSGTRLIHKEAFSGLFVTLFWNKLNQFVPGMLNSMNEALKEKSEKN